MLIDASETVQHMKYEAGAVNAHGNAVDAWAAPASVAIIAFDPGSTSEPRLPGQDRVIIEPTLYLPEGTMFEPRDLVIARSLVFEVDGGTRTWKHPSLGPAGNVVTLRCVTG